ncbi:hypothetical protein SCHPADRAFT_995169 [Schizopora paradoxa]|uniref:RRM domain-containing protein n=1 Tax=Schizopora paradoxa TaxID=27342 RepID=A0A0H2RWC0_9AGAM|nr:hypothetical protein SCHPADRAFT_995169 [Schizopora paradoxa]
MARYRHLAEHAARQAHLNAPGPSRVAKANKGKERASGHNRPLPTKEELAMKKARRERIHMKRTRSHVYVGNLSPSVTEGDLEEIFRSSGPVGRVHIRRTSHYISELDETLNDAEAGPSTSDSPRYATVEFYDPHSSRSAIQQTGTVIDGSRITVVLTASDLPEVKRIRERHHQLRENGGNIFKTGIPLQPTLVIETPDSCGSQSNAENYRVLGRMAGNDPALISSTHKVRFHRVRK